MWYVYFLQSLSESYLYIGHTSDLKQRLKHHNEGLNQSTKHYAPFFIEAYVAVRSKERAIELEKYFKTGSGKAILRKRILSLPQVRTQE